MKSTKVTKKHAALFVTLAKAGIQSSRQRYSRNPADSVRARCTVALKAVGNLLQSLPPVPPFRRKRESSFWSDTPQELRQHLGSGPWIQPQSPWDKMMDLPSCFFVTLVDSAHASRFLN